MSKPPQSPYLFDIRSPYTIGLSDLQLRLEPLLLTLMEDGSPHAATVQGALDCLLQVAKRDQDYEAAYRGVLEGRSPCRMWGCVETFFDAYARDNHEHAHENKQQPCGDPECAFYCNQEDDDD